MSTDKPITYQDAGVNIDAGNALVERIKPLVAKTNRPEVIGGIGGFAGLFTIDPSRYQQPTLIACTDGVGTKLKLAIDHRQLFNIGIDLVAMCVNDLIVVGGEPLFFLDYYATSRLMVDNASEVIAGISDGCQQAGAALLGGETAEMPGLYQPNDFDVAGFCVGIVDKPKLIDGTNCKAGDVILGLASSGFHANGFSLVRKLLAESNSTAPTAATLLAPTKIYVKTVRAILEQFDIHAMAHITGGGLLENIPRVLPAHLHATLHQSQWPLLEVFSWCQQAGNLSHHELYRTFNCGIGYVVILDKAKADDCLALLTSLGESAYIIGELTESASTQTERVSIN